MSIEKFAEVLNFLGIDSHILPGVLKQTIKLSTPDLLSSSIRNYNEIVDAFEGELHMKRGKDSMMCSV